MSSKIALSDTIGHAAGQSHVVSVSWVDSVEIAPLVEEISI